MWSSIAVRTAAAVRIHCLKLQPQCSVLSHRLIRSARPPVAQPFEEGHDATEPPVREVGTDQTLDLIPQLSGRERRLAAILIAYSFTPDHVRRIIEHFRYKSSLYEFEPETLRESIQFWLNNVHPDKARRLHGVSTSFDYSDSKFRDAVTLRDTLANNDPNLLLINTKMMEKRIDSLKKLGIFSGRKDFWSVFVAAPSAFFLQDWAEFNRKFYYLQHRVMDWMIDAHRDPFPTPHPCIKHAKVFELPYETLKSRFEFALKAGIKSPVAAMKDCGKKKTQIDVDVLFLYPVEKYLNTIAPAITEEEYYVFEQMVEEYPDDEDRTILEIVRLQTAGQTLAPHERIELQDEEEEDDSDSESDESQYRRAHKLKECLSSGRRKVYRINFEADENAARRRHEERLTKLSE